MRNAAKYTNPATPTASSPGPPDPPKPPSRPSRGALIAAASGTDGPASQRLARASRRRSIVSAVLQAVAPVGASRLARVLDPDDGPAPPFGLGRDGAALGGEAKAGVRARGWSRAGPDDGGHGG